MAVYAFALDMLLMSTILRKFYSTSLRNTLYFFQRNQLFAHLFPFFKAEHTCIKQTFVISLALTKKQRRISSESWFLKVNWQARVNKCKVHILARSQAQ